MGSREWGRMMIDVGERRGPAIPDVIPEPFGAVCRIDSPARCNRCASRGVFHRGRLAASGPDIDIDSPALNSEALPFVQKSGLGALSIIPQSL